MNCGTLLLSLHIRKSQKGGNIKFLSAFHQLVLTLFITIITSQCTMDQPQKVIVLGPNEVLPRPGDTVYSLAHRYKVSVRDLIQANGLNPPYILRENVRLILPVKGGRSSGTPSQPLEGPQLIQPDASTQWTDVQDTQADVASLEKEAPDPRLLQESQKDIPSSPPETTPSKKSKDKSQKSSSLTFQYPVQGTISQGFGNGKSKNSLGLRFQTDSQATVKPAAAGTVLLAGDELGQGQKMEVVQHPDVCLTAYVNIYKI
jgi:murein DD-endopeptidase MepM/ murein hydrolase activator NlpD